MTTEQNKFANNVQKQIFVTFAGFISFGLILGGWYVSSRMLVAAKPPAIATVAHVEVPRPALAPVAPMVAAEPAPAIVVPIPAPVAIKPRLSPVEVKAQTVEPRPGETYLQLAAMGPLTTEAYLKELAAKGIQPLIGPGPSETIHRILVGPYATSAQMKAAQDSFAGQGIQTLVRTY